MFSSIKLCIAGQVGASDMPMLSFSCFSPLPSCPSHPAPDGIIIVIILTPSLSLSPAVSRMQLLVPSTQRTDESKRERKGGREETVLLIKLKKKADFFISSEQLVLFSGSGSSCEEIGSRWSRVWSFLQGSFGLWPFRNLRISMSVLRRNRSSKCSSESVYDMLQLVSQFK